MTHVGSSGDGAIWLCAERVGWIEKASVLVVPLPIPETEPMPMTTTLGALWLLLPALGKQEMILQICIRNVLYDLKHRLKGLHG